MTRPRSTSGPIDALGAVLSSIKARLSAVELVAHKHDGPALIDPGAWTAWTPTVSQPTTVAATVNAATYTQLGKLVIASFSVSITGTGTGGNAVVVSLPVTAARADDHCGSVRIYDASVSTSYLGIAWLQTTTTMRFRGDWSGSGAWGFIPNVGLAASDSIIGTLVYEAA